MMTDMFLQIDNSKAGKYAFALTGRGLPPLYQITQGVASLALGYALVGLSAR